MKRKAEALARRRTNRLQILNEEPKQVEKVGEDVDYYESINKLFEENEK